ncbi:hypothetical protein CT0861_05416, partial [Colletotrichum tofieldiae]
LLPRVSTSASKVGPVASAVKEGKGEDAQFCIVYQECVCVRGREGDREQDLNVFFGRFCAAAGGTALFYERAEDVQRKEGFRHYEPQRTWPPQRDKLGERKKRPGKPRSSPGCSGERLGWVEGNSRAWRFRGRPVGRAGGERYMAALTDDLPTYFLAPPTEREYCVVIVMWFLADNAFSSPREQISGLEFRVLFLGFIIHPFFPLTSVNLVRDQA